MKHVDAQFVREDGTEDVSELVIVVNVQIMKSPENYSSPVFQASPDLRPCTFNTNFSNEPAFATGDLFARHPSNPTLWRIVGRKDDQIIHSNGEKTNPGPFGRRKKLILSKWESDF